MLELLVPRLRVRGQIVEAVQPRPEPVACVGDWLVRWARERPDATYLAERRGDGAWQRLCEDRVGRRAGADRVYN